MPNWIELQKSEDEMELFLTLHKRADGRDITQNSIKDEMRRSGFQLGIDDRAISMMLAQSKYDEPVVVAKGQMPGEAKPGYYEFFFNINAERGIPSILEDGTVDYSHVMELVEKGTLLATYHKVLPSKSGYTVTGAMVEGTTAEELPALEMDGVYREGDDYFAAQDGRVTLNGGSIKVDPALVVNGSVTVAYGNIDFTGDVLVRGDINSGMVVKANGTITVEGAVEGAKIVAGKDLIIGQGIHGEQKANIIADGTLVCKFIENAEVNVLGDVDTGYIVNSEVISEGMVDISKGRGIIMGGTVCGLKGVKAKVIGHRSHTPTRVFCGATPRDTQLLKRMRMSVKSCKVYMERLEEEENKLFVGVADKEKAMEKNAALRERVNTNREEYEQIKNKLMKCSMAVEKLLEKIDLYTGCEIEATTMCYGGCNITINTVSKEQYDDVKAVKFVQDGMSVTGIGL